jgi:hypothetical protein
MTEPSESPFPPRGRGELPATPRGLLTAATLLGVFGFGGFVLVFTTLRGGTSGGVVIAVALAVIGTAAILVGVRFAALGRSARRSCELSGGDQARAVCVAREAGSLISTSGRVITATDKGVLVLHARLLREPDVIAALPYRGIVGCQTAADTLELNTARGEVLHFAGVVPSQGRALRGVVSKRLSAARAAA